jgi:protein-disulfide isomerase
MKSRLVSNSAIISLAVILLFVSSGTNAQTPASAAKPISAEQRETIETVLREYLLKNPSIIREASQALQQQEEREKQERAKAGLKTFNAEIYSDQDSPSVGNPKADVTVVVFFDYNCGYCKGTVPELENLVKQDPSLRLIYKEYPILGAQSLIAARAALAASRQGKYVEFHRALMASQAIDIAVVKAISVRLGLNYAKLRQDMDDPQLTESLQRNIRLANSLEINGTPAYIVGGRLIPGAIDATALAQLVSDERAKLVTPNTAGVVEARK